MLDCRALSQCRISLALGVLCGPLALLSSAGFAHASNFYNFFQVGTNEVLATVDLHGNSPWDHADVVSVQFTPAGDAYFGSVLGTDPIPGPFTSSINAFVEDGIGGLKSNAQFGSAFLTLDGFPDSNDQLELTASFLVTATGTDTIIFSDVDAPPVPAPGGDWRFVPEPASFILIIFGLALVAFGNFRHARGRRIRCSTGYSSCR